MICKNCNFKNKKGSKFCQNCGEELTTKTGVLENKKTESTRKINIDEINDVIFEPKKADRSLLIFSIVLIIALVIGALGIVVIFSSPSSNQNNQQTSQENPLLVCLELSNQSVQGSSIYQPDPTFKATLYNDCGKSVSNVVVKINLYDSSVQSTTEKPEDTEYVTVANFLGDGDSTSINGTFKTNFDTTNDFRWYASLSDAK